MKKIIIAIAVITALIVATPYIHEFFNIHSKEGNPVTVTIPEGTSAGRIASILKENNIIKHEFMFKLKVKLSGKNTKLNFGTYILSDGMCLADVIDILCKPANGGSISLSVPEGYSAERIAEKADELGICSREEFLKALEDDYDYEFLSCIPAGEYKYRLQGFLFPETYLFSKNTTAHLIIDTMLGEFEKRYTETIGEIDENTFEIITKASLVEKEAMLTDERPIIAGVIENRIEASMPLQIDAAIVYAISDGMYDVEQVLYTDLEIDSPYNIYRNEGLPAGPICNPGMSAIEAAYNPDDNEYLFYHTDEEKKDGSHIFTKTYGEHVNTMN